MSFSIPKITVYPLLFLGMGILPFSCKTEKTLKLQLPEVAPNVLIDISSSGLGPCEPSIYINPANPQQIVAGAIIDRAYFSDDGGLTWEKQQLRSSYGVYGDPVILANPKGHFFYAHLADPSGRGRANDSWLDRIVVQKSLDGGRTWNNGSYAGLRPPKDQDKHWMAAHPEKPHLYLTWTEFDQYGSRDPKHKSRILFSRSVDEGLSWSKAIAINELDGNCLDDDDTTEGAVPAVGPAGEIYVAWSYQGKIYFDRSLDEGETWLAKDKVVADQPGGWAQDISGLMRCNGMPVTVVDLSESPFRGTIYVTWSDQRNGPSDTDIWLSYSRDQGDTWSDPIRVNNDAPGKHQFFPWMAIDQTTGAIYIVFYDRRAYASEMTDVYLASSFDGGLTFSNQRISESPFRPTPNVFFGDYNNISAHDGHVRPIWTRLEDRKLSIWTALIEVREKNR